MNNGLILLLTFTIPIVIVILFCFLTRNRKKRHLVSLDSDWRNFKKAIEHKDINGINKYGTEVIWNENLTNDMLIEMNDYLDKVVLDNSELENLKNIIFNKKLNLSRGYSGSFFNN